VTLALVNPACGRRWGPAVAALEARQDLETLRCEGRAQLSAQVRRAIAEGRDRVLVCGGDGTLHVAIQELAGSSCALGIVPLGSGNDLARALGLPLAPAAAADRALTGTIRSIDLGRIGDRWFAGIAGMGLDAAVARRVMELPRWVRGPWVYPWVLLRTLPGFVPPSVRIEFDETIIEGPALLAAVANTPCYGGGMRLAPEATVDDGWLDLVVLRPCGLPRLFALLPRLYRVQSSPPPEVHRDRFRRATWFADPPQEVYADGELVARCDASGLSIDLVPKVLAVVV
jgi:diacylglycerol kinase (ATP)